MQEAVPRLPFVVGESSIADVLEKYGRWKMEYGKVGKTGRAEIGLSMYLL
jgi:hypothetical protein